MKKHKILAFFILMSIFLIGCDSQSSNSSSSMNVESNIQTASEESIDITEDIETEAVTETTWQSEYRKLLEEIMNDKTYSDQSPHFSLHDLTGDGIPELFISDGFNRINSCKIYGFDESLIFMEKHGIDGETAYSPDNKIFYDYDIAQGHEYFIYYTLDENNNFKHEITLYNNVGAAPTEEDRIYTINNQKVSYDTYKGNLDMYQEIDDFVLLGRDYEFTEEDILKAFS